MKPVIRLICLAMTLSSLPAHGAKGAPAVAKNDAFLVHSWTQGMERAFRATDRNHDGAISDDEVPKKHAFELFKTYDFDRNGHITLEEWCGPRYQGPGAAHLQLDAANYFPWLDRNQDGRIDEKELKKLALYTPSGLMAKPDGVLSSTFAKAGLDTDRVLTRLEFERFLGILFAQGVGWGKASLQRP